MVLILIMLGGFLIRAILYNEDYFMLLNIPVYGFLIFKVLRHIKKIKNISYDDSSIYYTKDNYEVQIPFEDIKSIDIKSLDGVYEIKFHAPTPDGDQLFFKTSLWYPLNFQRQDDKVIELRDKIDRYKKTLPGYNLNELPSYNL
jgi:hypothetical protein